MAKTKIIYIPSDKENIWDEIEKEAKEQNRGVGYYICEKWKKNKIKKEEVK